MPMYGVSYFKEGKRNTRIYTIKHYRDDFIKILKTDSKVKSLVKFTRKSSVKIIGKDYNIY